MIMILTPWQLIFPLKCYLQNKLSPPNNIQLPSANPKYLALPQIFASGTIYKIFLRSKQPQDVGFTQNIREL
jgi:hypothetical protein